MTIHDRFASDCSQELFDSIYADLYRLAMCQQKSIHAACLRTHGAPRKGPVKGYYVGENQEALNAFVRGSLSVADALEHIRIQRVYTPE